MELYLTVDMYNIHTNTVYTTVGDVSVNRGDDEDNINIPYNSL